MDFRIREESIDVLPEYGRVPIALEVKSRFRVELVANGLGESSSLRNPSIRPTSKTTTNPAARNAGPGKRGISRGGLSSLRIGSESASAEPLSPFMARG